MTLRDGEGQTEKHNEARVKLRGLEGWQEEVMERDRGQGQAREADQDERGGGAASFNANWKKMPAS